MTGVYVCYDFDPEKHQALDKLDAHLLRVLYGKGQQKVGC